MLRIGNVTFRIGNVGDSLADLSASVSRQTAFDNANAAPNLRRFFGFS
jgi:hypothetical protein